jgi:hypothetical protein
VRVDDVQNNVAGHGSQRPTLFVRVIVELVDAIRIVESLAGRLDLTPCLRALPWALAKRSSRMASYRIVP